MPIKVKHISKKYIKTYFPGEKQNILVRVEQRNVTLHESILEVGSF